MLQGKIMANINQCTNVIYLHVIYLLPFTVYLHCSLGNDTEMLQNDNPNIHVYDFFINPRIL